MKRKRKPSLILLAVVISFLQCQKIPREVHKMNQKSDNPFLRNRQRMVEKQIIARGVKDSLVLTALMNVERHKFVPPHLQEKAYNDEPLPIGHNQTISQPYIVAYMTEALSLKKDDKVLEIGTGSGYQAAVLGEIVKEVYTIEIVRPLFEEAQKILKKEKYPNVHCRYGDGYLGWPEEALFDAIIVTAAPPRIPEPLIDQLKEGGRMILPVGTYYQELILLTKQKGNINTKRLIPVRFVPMTGKVQQGKKK